VREKRFGQLFDNRYGVVGTDRQSSPILERLTFARTFAR
jgi:hypothetical protein